MRGPAVNPKALDQARRRRVVKPPDQRRREILEAATALFGRQGYEVTTVQAIATSAGVAAGTVYLYFPSKEAILDALREDFEGGLLDQVAAIATAVLEEEDASGEIVRYEEVVERLIDAMVAYSLGNRAAAEVLAQHKGPAAGTADPLRIDSGLNDVLSRVIGEGIRLGYVHTSDPEMAAYLLNLAAATAVGNAIASHDEEMLQRVVAQTKELYIKALAPPRPHRRSVTSRGVSSSGAAGVVLREMRDADVGASFEHQLDPVAVFAWVAGHNGGWIRVLEKCGFTHAAEQPPPEEDGTIMVALELKP